MKRHPWFRNFVLSACGFGLAAPASADHILVFKAPNTWAGQSGGENLVYHGQADLGGMHYAVGSAFYDNQESRFIVGADRADTGGWDSPNGFYESELVIGRSADGIGFTDWRRVLWVNPTADGIRIYNLSVLPDPARPRVWFGLFAYTLQSGPTGTARIEIDNNTNQVKVSNGASTWKTYPLDSHLDIVPYAVSGARVRSFAAVNANGFVGYEFWTMAASAPRSGKIPCTGGVATPTYTANTSSDTEGRKARLYTYNPSTFATAGPVDMVPGAVWPTDYGASSIVLVTRVDLGSREAHYVGSTDRRICELPDIWNPWAGSGIRFLRIDRQANGAYAEVATTWMLNTKVPNWTCAPGIATCYAPTQNHYAFTGAYPVVRGNEIFFYVEVWGGFVPQ